MESRGLSLGNDVLEELHCPLHVSLVRVSLGYSAD